MNEPGLHAFDHALCDHLVEVTRVAAAANPKYGRMIEAELPGLTGEEAKPELLLSEWDLRLIETAAAFALVRDRWVPDVLAYERWVDGLGEIHAGLGDRYAEAWHDLSVETAGRLGAADFRFDVGVEIVREWLEEARRYLGAIHRRDLVPRPGGGHPTWGSPQPTVNLATPSGEQYEAPPVCPEPNVRDAVAAANEPPRMYDTKQVAARLNVSERHVYRMRDAGRMPQPLKMGRSVKWTPEVIERWITDGCPSCPSMRRPR